MPRYERMPLHEESERAPSGVCELTIQSTNRGAFDIAPRMQKVITDYIEGTIQVKAFEYDNPAENDRLVIYTGTDRLDIATLRDISEVYGMVTEYDEGNIPPDLTLVPTSGDRGTDSFFTWFEFKLEMELPAKEIQTQIERDIPNAEITPKNPVGENMSAIVYRNGNVSNHQVRDILNKASQTSDAVPVDYIRLVCEPKG